MKWEREKERKAERSTKTKMTQQNRTSGEDFTHLSVKTVFSPGGSVG